jgi:cytidyltransferase-like protein
MAMDFPIGRTMKLGILGGTFNPIHLGHLRAAEEIGEDLTLDKVYLIPSGIPPHKTKGPIADFPHRLKMVRLASELSPLLEAWDIEGIRGGFSYSIETLKALHYHRNRCLPGDKNLERISEPFQLCILCGNPTAGTYNRSAHGVSRLPRCRLQMGFERGTLPASFWNGAVSKGCHPDGYIGECHQAKGGKREIDTILGP